MNLSIVVAMLMLGAEGELPKQAQQATETYQDAVLAAKNSFDRSVATAHASYLMALQRTIAAETRAGRLDSAIAVKEVHEESKAVGPIKVDVGFDDSAKSDLAKMAKGFARIQSTSLVPTVLRESDDKNGWRQVPDGLKHVRSVVCVGNDRDGGVADFTITKSGTLMVICDYSYQGNSSGNWTEHRWTKEQFIENGWTEVKKELLGGEIIDASGNEQSLFMKQVKKGEHYRLRCNKYRCPQVLILY